MDWQERFYEFMTLWMLDRGYKVKKVLDVQESVYDVGGCDTCGHDMQFNVNILYIGLDGNEHWEYIDDMSIAELF